MQPFAILRTAKIKDFMALRRQIDHAERTAKTLPTNADSIRQHLNHRLFPDAPGPEHAITRWKTRVAKATVRKNAVVAVEIFLGMSPNHQLTPHQLADWHQTSLNWVAQNFGGTTNLIAGAFNGDERTPHLHVFVVPIDPKGHLNCRHFLGAKAKLHTLQSSYATAVAPYGLRRGITGSKRKHIPQRVLYEFRNDVQRKVDDLQHRLKTELDQLQDPGFLTWQFQRQQILQSFTQTLQSLQQQVAPLAELAKESLLARATAPNLVTAAQHAQAQAEAAQTQAKTEKLRADQALKDQAALVRSLPLAPLAQEILGLAPVEKDGVFWFTDDNTTLRIHGHKFSDTKDPACQGSGAIDLVCKLTKRNFKGAVEFLITRHSAAEIVADHTGVAQAQCQTAIQAAKPQPRIITLADVPKRIWQPCPNHWPTLLNRLATQHHLDRSFLLHLHQQAALWAVSPSTLAVPRSPIPANDPAAAPAGVTLLDLDDPLLRPRVLAPSQPAAFWLRSPFSTAQNIILTANPLEALSYRQLCTQFPNDIAAYSAPHIISADGPLPTPSLLQSIDPARQRLILATHAPVSPDDLAHHHTSVAQDRRPADWLTILNAQPNVPEAEQAKAWNRKLIALTQFSPEKVLVRSR